MTSPATPPPPAWTVLSATADPGAVRHLAQQFALPVPLVHALWCRGLRDPAAVHAFLHPDAAALHPPALMQGLEAAVHRLERAIATGEPILIYGDYDVDGTVATVLLKTALERVAAALGTTADVRFHIPHRIREGYGMRETRIADAAAEGVRLVISVDTGIRAFAAAEEARRHGLDLIVTDHHLPEGAGRLPDAIAVLNPNQPGCPYPFKELCGAGVAFKLAQALLAGAARDPESQRRLRDKTLPSFLKLLAIATVADAVPLTGENRIIASLGLQALRQPVQSGLRTLMELAGIDLTRPVSASDVGFRIGPRINAAGRMEVASDVVDMFLTRDPVRARELAQKLHHLNDQRRSTEARALDAIEEQLRLMAAAGTVPRCVVLDDAAEPEPWHRGVVGILASRVVERTGRPALVLTHENGEAHGSGRSVAGFHLLDALTASHAAGGGLFLRFGGHAHAAGFVLPSGRVPELRAHLQQHAATRLPERLPDLLPPCEAELSLADLTPAFLAAYDRFQPFGHGHPEPLFLLRGLCLAAPPRLLKERHLALQLTDAEGRLRWRATAWGRRVDWAARSAALGLAQGSRVDLACTLERNWHPEFGGWELQIRELVCLAR